MRGGDKHTEVRVVPLSILPKIEKEWECVRTMTVQIGIVLLTFVIFVVLILSNKVKIDLAAMAIPIILEVTQILDFGEAWSGLVNNSVIMMASMFVVGAAVGKTSLLGKMTGVLIKPGASDLKIMIGIAIPILFLGNFVNGVATLTIVIPMIVGICAEQQRPISKFIYPAAYWPTSGLASCPQAAMRRAICSIIRSLKI